MEWLELSRKWLSDRINRDPNVFPLRLRRDIAITSMWVIFFYSFSLFRINFFHAVAACGIVLGIFGARMLYWETIATPEELESVGNQIAGAGRTTNLSDNELMQILILYIIGLATFGFLTFYVFEMAKYKPSIELHTELVAVGGLFLICFSPSFGWSLLIRRTHRWCSRWLKDFEHSDYQFRKAEIKRVLRSSGFRSLLIAGLMQLPAALV